MNALVLPSHTDASFRRRVLLQAPLVADPPPYVQGDFVVGVVRDPETDVEHVVRLDVPDMPGVPD